MTTTEIPIAAPNLDVPEQWRLGQAFVPKGRYLDAEFLKLETERLFPRTWLNACRFDEVERVGDYVDFEICGQSIVVVRTDQGLRAYFNACRHRGTRLVQGQGRIGEFRCPFHAWRWNLDGSLKYQADEGNFDPRPAGELCLPEVQVDTWGGWVFINMDPHAEPLLDYLAPMPARLEGYKLEDMRIAWHKSVLVDTNWKTSLDAFNESWHVPGTHPQLTRSDKHTSPPTIAESEAYGKTFNELFRYHSRHADIFRYGSEGSSTRLRPEYGVNPDAVYDNVVYNFRELRSLYLPTDLGAAAELRTIPEARGPEGNAIYQQLRKKHARAAGVDYPELSEEQLKAGMYDWHVFPNTVFLVDFGTCLAYRARPNGKDPDKCIFDVWGLWLPPAEGIETAPPEHFSDWRVASLGTILEQDFSNMSEVAVGMHSLGYDGHRLNLAQEMTIWNYHHAIDEFLFWVVSDTKFGWLSPVASHAGSDFKPIAIFQAEHIFPSVLPHFDSVWIADHFYGFDAAKKEGFLEAWTTLTWLAAKFDHVDLAHHVLGQGYRNPALIAKMASTLQVLTGGRFILGIGAGWREDEYRAYGYDFPSTAVRLHQLEEVVQICRAMWTEEHPTFHGKYFDIDDAAATPRPDVAPPVCIGSSGETIGLKIVGRHADMWNTAVPDEESWKRKHNIVCEAATAFGRDSGDVTCCLTLAGPLPESDQDSEQWLGRLTGFRDLGVSYFVLDFGHPLSAEPALRFAEQVIAPMRRVTS